MTIVMRVRGRLEHRDAEQFQRHVGFLDHQPTHSDRDEIFRSGAGFFPDRSRPSGWFTEQADFRKVLQRVSHTRRWAPRQVCCRLVDVDVTLSPVFRSDRAIEILRSEGVWSRLEGASIGQRDAIRRVRADVPRVLDDRFLNVQGTVVAADNLFDEEQKSVLPLRAGAGSRCGSILQLIVFQRLTACAFDRAVATGSIAAADSDRILREMTSRMADIGKLEGSEERGVEEVLDVDTMLERVHRIRGGQLFELSLVAPGLVEPRERQPAIRRIGRAMSRLGTAFSNRRRSDRHRIRRGTGDRTVGAGTHPGAGIPAVLLSASAAYGCVRDDYGLRPAPDRERSMTARMANASAG
jgi:hypothetical protein